MTCLEACVSLVDLCLARNEVWTCTWTPGVKLTAYLTTVIVIIATKCYNSYEIRIYELSYNNGSGKHPLYSTTPLVTILSASILYQCRHVVT